MVCTLTLVSKPHLKTGSDELTLFFPPHFQLKLSLWLESPNVHAPPFLVSRSAPAELTNRDLVQHEGPGIQIFVLCGFCGGNLHAVRVSAADVVREDGAARHQLGEKV